MADTEGEVISVRECDQIYQQLMAAKEQAHLRDLGVAVEALKQETTAMSLRLDEAKRVAVEALKQETTAMSLRLNEAKRVMETAKKTQGIGRLVGGGSKRRRKSKSRKSSKKRRKSRKRKSRKRKSRKRKSRRK